MHHDRRRAQAFLFDQAEQSRRHWPAAAARSRATPDDRATRSRRCREWRCRRGRRSNAASVNYGICARTSAPPAAAGDRRHPASAGRCGRSTPASRSAARRRRRPAWSALRGRRARRSRHWHDLWRRRTRTARTSPARTSTARIWRPRKASDALQPSNALAVPVNACASSAASCKANNAARVNRALASITLRGLPQQADNVSNRCRSVCSNDLVKIERCRPSIC